MAAIDYPYDFGTVKASPGRLWDAAQKIANTRETLSTDHHTAFASYMDAMAYFMLVTGETNWPTIRAADDWWRLLRRPVDSSKTAIPSQGTVEITAQPADTNTIAVNDGTSSKTYEFESASGVTSGRIEVTIGADIEATLQNFVTAFNTGLTDTTNLSSNGVSARAFNIRPDATNPECLILVGETGANNNSITEAISGVTVTGLQFGAA